MHDTSGHPFDIHERLAHLGVGADAPVVVAVSGGCDSVVLLHLLLHGTGRFRGDLTVAHFDHGMRPGSDADARWVSGLCQAWGITARVERAAEPPTCEASARDARYAFLERVAGSVGAAHVLTAHHADDQAETVLFRVLRGTGVEGLAGIHPRRGTIVRPLLDVPRRELAAHARAKGLRWREDPTNRGTRPARNRIRHMALPALADAGFPMAARSLVRLGAHAAEERLAWASVLDALLADRIEREGDDLVLARDFFGRYDSPVAARIVRHLARHFGIVLTGAGTRMALQFISGGTSGKVLALADGVILRRELDRIRIARRAAVPPDETLLLATRDGRGTVRLAGWETVIAWQPGAAGAAAGPDTLALRLEGLALPLTIRGWCRGDRIRTAAGSKSLKKLFLERRVPRPERHRIPVVVDAGGTVRWVLGIAADPTSLASPGDPALTIARLHA